MAEKNNGPNWKKIKAEYIKGGISQQKLADKYGVHRSTLQLHMKREGWQQLRQETAAKAAQKLVEKTASSQAETLSKLQQMQNQAAVALYEKLLQNLINYPDGVGTRTKRETVDVKTIQIGEIQKSIPLRSAFTNDLEAIVRSMATLGKLFGLDAATDLDRKRLSLRANPYENDEIQDDGFIEALNACSDAWDVEDEPANITDNDDGGGEDYE